MKAVKAALDSYKDDIVRAITDNIKQQVLPALQIALHRPLTDPMQGIVPYAHQNLMHPGYGAPAAAGPFVPFNPGTVYHSSHSNHSNNVPGTTSGNDQTLKELLAQLQSKITS
jgi:hypothetical protein